MADQCNKQNKGILYIIAFFLGTVNPISMPLNTLVCLPCCQKFSHLGAELTTVQILWNCFPGPAISTEFSSRQNKNNAYALQGRESV